MQQSSNIFISTISCLKNKTTVNDLVNDFKDQLKVENLKRTTLQPQNLIRKFSQLQKRYQRGTLPANPQGWYQNERKLFLWFFLTYCHLHFKKSSEITPKEWKQFSECFHQKSPLLLRYQAILLQRNSQRVHWLPSEENLVKNCVNGSLNGKWSEVSRALFYQSEGEYFKTPKQCRQHWFNHMNTGIKKGGWSIDEDLMILNFVLNEGRHWSRLIQQLGRVRTEHMVKNRFATLLNLGRKYFNNNSDEHVLINSIANYLSSHKELIYEINASSSEQELMCKSEKSISLECCEVKGEDEKGKKEGNIATAVMIHEGCSTQKLEQENPLVDRSVEPIIEDETQKSQQRPQGIDIITTSVPLSNPYPYPYIYTYPYIPSPYSFVFNQPSLLNFVAVPPVSSSSASQQCYEQL